MGELIKVPTEDFIQPDSYLNATALESWDYLARDDQLPPDTDWDIWLLLGGRGSGKTRAGAEWVLEQVRNGAKRIALLAPTQHEGRIVMVEGESGLMNIGREGERPTWNPSLRQLRWPNGATAQLFSAEDPEGLRGPQFECAWADEFCSWAYPNEALSNLRLGLRLGELPKLVMTTTPKPMLELRALMESPGIVVSHAPTSHNDVFLAPGFLAMMRATYGGTLRARQELGGEIVENLEDSLWPRELIEDCRIAGPPPPMDRIVVAVDPPVTSGPEADACGLVVVGLADKVGYVLQDASAHGLSPAQWASRAASLYELWEADLIVVETNQGGDMVKQMIAQVDDSLPVKGVTARRAKGRRAEPVAMLYEQGRVKHVGAFAELEDEMNRMSVDGLSGRASPDRVDALVWGVTKLMLRRAAKPNMRRI